MDKVLTIANPAHSPAQRHADRVTVGTRIGSMLKDLISITKPKILSLLLISTVCPMVLAAGGKPDIFLVLWVLLGGALISASASAFNCIWERETDALMERTKNRPMAEGRLDISLAILFATVLGIAGYTVLDLMANRSAALIALAGHLFYVFVYTIWLKRSTPQNIVIGGAAGAVPPVVGWVAVTGSIDLNAFLMFLVIFLWTPPHFWALALNKNEDYKRAGIPMLPVVAGEEDTHRQMYWYALSLIPVGLLFVFVNKSLGWCSLAGITLLGATFAIKVYQLKALGQSSVNKEVRVKKAWDVFGFSLVYLMLFFVCIVVDSVFI